MNKNIMVFVFAIILFIAQLIEFIVFNEEILLIFCFISFLFFLYHYIRKSAQTTLLAQIDKIKQDFFSALKIKFDFLVGRCSNTKFLIKLTEKSKIHWSLHIFYLMKFMEATTNNIVSTYNIELINRELKNEKKSFKTTMTHFLLENIYLNLMYKIIKELYTKNVKIFLKKKSNITHKPIYC